MARRIESGSSGYRTVGYDPNPRGLSGTNSNNRRLAGTTATASDYKSAKKKKKAEENEKVQIGDPPPYANDDGFIPGHNGIWYNTEYDDPANKDYKVEKVVLGKGVKNTDGEGWILKLHFEKSDVENFLKKKIDGNDVSGALTGGSDRSMLYIRDVSSERQIKLPTSPLENGMVKHDHKVMQPKTLRISGLVERGRSLVMDGLLEYAAIHKSLKVYFELTSPWKVFKKMYLSGHKSKASNKMYDMYEYSLDLTELLIASDLKDTTDDAELASNTEKGSSSGK